MDDSNTNMPNHLFVSLNHEFQAVRVVEGRVRPTTIKIRVDASPTDVEDDLWRIEFSLNKIAHFVDNVLQGSVIISCLDDWALSAFLDEDRIEGQSNNVVLCPDLATDAVLAELLFSKMTKLSAQGLEIHSVEVSSTDTKNISFMFLGGDPCGDFPTGDEWLTPHNYFSTPWWHRDDASSLDVVPRDDQDVSVPPRWAYGLGELAQNIRDEPTSNNVVVRPEFKPRVIQGGRED